MDSDPSAPNTGVDVGVELGPKTMRAPDVSVGSFSDDTKGYAKEVPALALEYADSGQDKQWARVQRLDAEIAIIEQRLASILKETPQCQTVAAIPAVGLLTATAAVASIGDARTFKSGREFAA